MVRRTGALVRDVWSSGRVLEWAFRRPFGSRRSACDGWYLAFCSQVW